jgi:transcriptional regulator with XRE-family HTH domain
VPTPRGHLRTDVADERARRRLAFGSHLRSLREQHGLTQEQLALRSGLDRPFLVQVEGGRRSILVERLDDLAFGLGVEVRELVSYANPRNAG